MYPLLLHCCCNSSRFSPFAAPPKPDRYFLHCLFFVALGSARLQHTVHIIRPQPFLVLSLSLSLSAPLPSSSSYSPPPTQPLLHHSLSLPAPSNNSQWEFGGRGERKEKTHTQPQPFPFCTTTIFVVFHSTYCWCVCVREALLTCKTVRSNFGHRMTIESKRHSNDHSVQFIALPEQLIRLCIACNARSCNNRPWCLSHTSSPINVQM